MRVLHIATGKGGAMAAAQNLINYQKEHFIADSLLMSGAKDGLWSSILGVISKTVTVLQRYSATSDYGFISTYSVNRIDIREIFSLQPDVVHIHNWYNTLNLRTIEKISKKFPIIFTLHDERMLTGGCHMTLGCVKFKDNCTQCPASKSMRKLVARGKKRFDNFALESKLYAVTAPSNWLIQQAKTSQFGKNAMIMRKIPNIIGEYKGAEDKIQTNSKINGSFIFVASNINESIKGLTQLIEALDLTISENQSLIDVFNLTVVGYGNPIRSKYLKINYVGSLSNEDVHKTLRNSSLCFIPSKTENMPNVLLEAVKARVMVLASDVGGISEVVVDGFSGLLCQPDAKSIKIGLERYLKLSETEKLLMTENALKYVANVLNNRMTAEKYTLLYRESIEIFQNRNTL